VKQQGIKSSFAMLPDFLADTNVDVDSNNPQMMSGFWVGCWMGLMFE
jgi:hypothetical protein